MLGGMVFRPGGSRLHHDAMDRERMRVTKKGESISVSNQIQQPAPPISQTSTGREADLSQTRDIARLSARAADGKMDRGFGYRANEAISRQGTFFYRILRR